MRTVPLSPPAAKTIKAQVRRLVFGARPRCPRCHRTSTVHRSEGRFRCRCCRRPFSLTSGSWLSGMRLSWLQLWLLLWCFGHRYQPQQASDIAAVSLPTARRWYHHFRVHLPARDWLLEFVVCADEAYVGKRKTGNQRIVAGAREVVGREIRLAVIPDTAQDSLEGFLQRHVHPDTLVRTDAHPGYQAISWLGYTHETEIHEHGQLAKTVPIERVWSFTKWHLRRMYHHLWATTLPEFLREIEWRFAQPEIFENPLNLLTKLLPTVPTT